MQLSLGHEVVAFDVVPDYVKAATGKGAKAAKNVAEVAASAQTIVTMLPNNDAVSVSWRLRY